MLVQIVGEGVFVSEGFDLAIARQLSDTIASTQATGPVQQARTPDRELTLGLAQNLERFGLAQAAMLHAAAQAATLPPTKVVHQTSANPPSVVR